MSELFESVKNQVGAFLIAQGFTSRGKNAFVRKEKKHKREEVVTFSTRKSKTPHSSDIYIGVTAGIYLKELNTYDKKIINDFLNSYPIISGSIGHYKNSNPGFVSIPINNPTQVEIVSNQIISDIKSGAFNLFSKFPNTESILQGIIQKDEWLKDYHKFLSGREAIRVAAIYRLSEGKEVAIDWFEKNAQNSDNNKDGFLTAMKEYW